MTAVSPLGQIEDRAIVGNQYCFAVSTFNVGLVDINVTGKLVDDVTGRSQRQDFDAFFRLSDDMAGGKIANKGEPLDLQQFPFAGHNSSEEVPRFVVLKHSPVGEKNHVTAFENHLITFLQRHRVECIWLLKLSSGIVNIQSFRISTKCADPRASYFPHERATELSGRHVVQSHDVISGCCEETHHAASGK